MTTNSPYAIKTFRSYFPEMCDKDEYFGNIDVSFCSITSLEGSPRNVYGHFSVLRCPLGALIGAPSKVTNDFSCIDCNLNSVFGANIDILGDCLLDRNSLNNLSNFHKHFKSIHGRLSLKLNPIKSHVVSVLLIDKLTSIEMDDKVIEHILNKQLAGNRDVLGCIDELIEAGYSNYAQI